MTIFHSDCRMGFKNVVKKGFFSGLNPVRWIGLQQIKENGRVIGGITHHLFKTPKNIASGIAPKTFEECMQHYKLTEEDLKKRMQSSLRLAYFCLGLSVVMISYTIYLFSSHLVLSGFVTTMLTFLLWAYAFREHFNYFQMKRRQLGCTFREWFNGTFKGQA